jgi:predicted nuclease of predicted toxin-antitoxin system
MLKFLIDEQLPPALARWIATKGLSAQHVIDIDLGQTSDIDIVSFAQLHDLTLVSKDSDFLWLHAKDPGSFRLVHLAFGNQSNAELLASMEIAWSEIMSALVAGDRRVVVGP